MEDDYDDDYVLDLEGEGVPVNLEQNFEVCDEILKLHGKSESKGHQIVCASASALRIQLKQKGLPLTPLSYLDAIINTLSSPSSPLIDPNSTINPKSTSSLARFLVYLLYLTPPSQPVPSSKANEVVTLLVSLLKTSQSTGTIACVIKSLGYLIPLCDLRDLNFAKSVLEMTLKFSIDKRQPVKECAQVCVEKIFVSVQCFNLVNEEVSELFYSELFYKYLPDAIAIAWSRILITEGWKGSEPLPSLMLMETQSMLTVLKLIVLYLSNAVLSKVMDHVHMILGSKYSKLTEYTFAFLKVILESSSLDEIVVPKTEIIIFALGNYVLPQENNPDDTILSACALLKRCIDKLYADERSIWLINLPLVFEHLARVVDAELSVSEEAAGIMKELVNQHMDEDLTVLQQIPAAFRMMNPALAGSERNSAVSSDKA